MEYKVLEKLYVNDEEVDFGRRIINKSDINSISVVVANPIHNMRMDRLASTMGVEDTNQISILNEIMNPFTIEEGQSYLVPDGNLSKYYDATEPSYPVTESSSTTTTKDNNGSDLSTSEITAILEPKIDTNRQNRLNNK